MLKEIAPRRNTGIYLSGHLIAVSDALFPLLGFGERLFPPLEDVFIKQPDKSGQAMPTVTELKENRITVNTKLGLHFQSTTIEKWFDRHTSLISMTKYKILCAYSIAKEYFYIGYCSGMAL